MYNNSVTYFKKIKDSYDNCCDILNQYGINPQCVVFLAYDLLAYDLMETVDALEVVTKNICLLELGKESLNAGSNKKTTYQERLAFLYFAKRILENQIAGIAGKSQNNINQMRC